MTTLYCDYQYYILSLCYCRREHLTPEQIKHFEELTKRINSGDISEDMTQQVGMLYPSIHSFIHPLTYVLIYLSIHIPAYVSIKYYHNYCFIDVIILTFL